MNRQEINAARKARRLAIAEAYKSGLTMTEVGAKFGISKQNVYTLLRKEGIAGSDNERRRRFEAKCAALDEQRNAECLKRWGCTWEQFSPLAKIKGLNRPVARFGDHRTNAGRRGVGFELTFWQWWTIWLESGHWAERGKQGYVMCRRGDIGPYAVGNVFIALAIENSSNTAHKKSGLPMGVVRLKGRNDFLAARTIGGVYYYLGYHATPELAHSAYLACGLRHMPSVDEIHSLSPVGVTA